MEIQLNQTGPIETTRTDAKGFFSAELATPLAAIAVPVGDDQTKTIPVGTLFVLPGAIVDLGNVDLDSQHPEKPHLRIVGPIQLLKPSRGAKARDHRVAALIAGCSGPAQDPCDWNSLTLVQANGDTTEPVGLKDQIGVSNPLISADGGAAGWLPNVPFCCTSYPISPYLVVYRPDEPVRVFHGDGRAIFKWKFVASGEQVAFYQDFLHGTPAQHYELRDITTGRLLSHWEGEVSASAPSWTKGL